MLKGIRGRLILYYLIVIAVVVVSMGVFFIWFLNYVYMQTLQENLYTQARLASALIYEMDARGAQQAEIDDLAKELGEELGLRLTLINYSGKVIADSAEDPLVMENHLSRPEVLDAINLGRGLSSRYSTTVSEEMYYLAVPLKDRQVEADHNPIPNAIIRLALPLVSINKALSNLKLFIIGVLCLSSLLAFFAALLLAQRITGPIHQIKSATQAIAAGNYTPVIKVNSSDELNDLANMISEMGINLKEKMDQVLGEKNKLEIVISSMSSGVILADRDLMIELINPAAEKLFDVKRDEAVGFPLQKIIRNYTLYENLKAVKDENRAKVIEINAYYPRSAVLETYLLPVTGSGEDLIGILLLFHEITHVRSLEKMRSDFVANVSHELRTPLTAIRGYTETILHEELQDEQLKSFLKIIDRETLRLSDLLNDLLDLAQIENEKGFVKKETVNLKKMINEAIVRVDLLREQYQVQIECLLASEDLAVSGNYEWLCQALINILENSIRHGKDGGTIKISLEKNQDNAILEVCDDGPGIPEADLPYIFERFYRVDKARSRKSGGTGLGLSIVKHILEAHDAQYQIKSREGEGIIFSFTLPLIG
jgi:two-component system, OmpR family, phosphate regulon sensor histidine kinase PhoR